MTNTELPQFGITPRAFIENAFDDSGVVSLRLLYDAARVLGLDEQPVRLAIRRLAAAGYLSQVGRGRAGELFLSDSAIQRHRLDREYWEFSLALDVGAVHWDGVWHLYAFSIPELRRADRDALRVALGYLGAAQLTPGLYISPYDLRPDIATELSPRDVSGDVTHLGATQVEHQGRPLAGQIAELWDLADLHLRYRGLTEALDLGERQLAVETSPATRLATRVVMLSALNHALVPDPLLPPDLLPTDWPGAAVRQRFAELFERYRLAVVAPPESI